MAEITSFNGGVTSVLNLVPKIKSRPVIVLYSAGAHQGKTKFTQGLLNGIFRQYKRIFTGFHCDIPIEKKSIPRFGFKPDGYLLVPIIYQPDSINVEMMNESCRRYFRKSSDYSIYIYNPNDYSPPNGIENRVDLIIENPDARKK